MKIILPSYLKNEPSLALSFLSDALTALPDGETAVFEGGILRLGNEKGERLFRALMSGEIAATDYNAWHQNANPAFLLSHRRDLTIDGNGTTLLFSGLIRPFELDGCRRITLKNLTIDWERPPFSCGRVLSSDGNGIRVRLDDGYPLRGGEPVVSYQDFDPAGTRPGGRCIFEGADNVLSLSEEEVLLRGPESAFFAPGSGILFRHLYSYAPLIHLLGCEEIRMENVTLHAGPGMGVIAHRCRDLTFDRLQVVPSEGRPLSVNCDATHFIGCSGLISFRDCRFEAMGDDAANLHGFYLTTLRTRSPAMAEAELTVTTQDFTEEFPEVGDTVAFVHRETLLPYEPHKNRTVEEVTRLAEGRYLFRFTKPLPDGFRPGDLMMNLSRSASLRFERCTVRNIRGRALLLQTRDVQVRDCLFESCTGEGIHINTADGWAESGAAGEIEIRDCRFLDCGYGHTKYCDAVGIVVGTECPEPAVGVHRNIRILNNHFEGNRVAVLLSCCQAVELADNRYCCGNERVKLDHAEEIVIRDCPADSVSIGENTARITVTEEALR